MPSAIELQWHRARWSAGVLGLIMGAHQPAHVPDSVIDEIRGREVGGLIELAPPPALRRDARVRIVAGPFANHLAIYAGMKPRERVEILLQLLGAVQRVELPKDAVEVVSS
jgi:transcription antitermination factor NusG